MIWMTGTASVGSGLDAGMWDALPRAESIGMALGVPSAVILVRTLCMVARANRAIGALVTNSVAVAACAGCGILTLVRVELVTPTTAAVIAHAALALGFAAMVAGFDDEEIKGRRTDTRPFRERIQARPGVSFLVWPVVAGALVSLAGIPLESVSIGRMCIAAGVVGGALLFAIRDTSTGGTGHWP